ncbi:MULTISPECIES: DUF2322 family protein [Silvimonas]|uniref:DUF2322 family protein n=1 Tax=Silvimonas TaxID=300264 RepID=UPI0024B3A04A|nr:MULTISPECIES: DUF2322 family protein [Silvimonas]MDR3426859.1 DUF2322 family protein [Silvimonas sp.]
MQFSEVLATLPSVDHLGALELLEGEAVAARLENRPGQAGSVRVYHALYQEFGAIDTVAADKGLRLYAEHTEDALKHPGKHPNIDRLLMLAEGGQPLSVRLVAAV